jgi:hypothetical protein
MSDGEYTLQDINREMERIWFTGIFVSFQEAGLTVEPKLSGKEAALLSPPPLRTAHMTFAICRSSLSNALLGTRFRYSQTKAVNLPVAYRM